MRAPRPWLAYAALGAIVVAGSLLRLHNLHHGLPEVYHPDEAQHFTSRAIAMFGGDLNPYYFENPSAFTYLLYGLLRAQAGWPLGGGDPSALLVAYGMEPAGAYAAGRVLATALCMLAVLGVFGVGRRLWNPAAGVAAAAVLSFAFLPVAYSRYSLTDTGVLLPVVLATYGAVRAWEDGRVRFYVLTGLGVGLAVGFKYTAGLVGVPLVLAALGRLRRDRRVVPGLLASGLAAIAAFALTTPYFLLHIGEAVGQLRDQSEAASLPKLGQAEGSAAPYYLRSLTWGLGWGALLAAAGGAALEVRAGRRMRAALLVLFPLVLFLYLSTAGRFFARWLLPTYPLLALLAGAGIAHVAARVSRRPVLRAGAVALLLVAVLAQPLAAGIRTSEVLGRDDTRVLARKFLVRKLPPDARVVVEPAVPKRYFDGRLVVGFKAPPRELVEGGTPQRFIRSLRPSRIARYRAAGYCTVVVLSAVQERARLDRIGLALAYYKRLARESRVVFRASPYRAGAARPRFNFDWSTHLFYPRSYERPGPEVWVRRLKRCKQQAGGKPAYLPPPASILRPGIQAVDSRGS